MNTTLLYVDTSIPFSQYEKYLKYVSPERGIKIGQYHFDHDKTLSLFSHLLTRFCISQDLNIPFNDVEVLYTENGKPYIEREGYHFSVSHSGDLTAFVSHSSPVGIDVQKTKENISSALRFFTANEQQYIQNNSEKFFEIWTKKEAYVKMLGTGLGMSFKTFDVLNHDLKQLFITEKYPGYIISICAANMQSTPNKINIYKKVN